MKEYKLTGTDFKLFMYIRYKNNKFKVSEVAKKTGLTPDSIMRSLNFLDGINFIERIKHNRKGDNLTCLINSRSDWDEIWN